jgi:hypothetical protein
VTVPSEVEHTLVWTRLPIFHKDLIPDCIAARIDQDGLCGFTGNTSPPPSPSTLPSCLPALADWGITMDKLVRSKRGTEEEEELVRNAGKNVHNFVKKRWVESEWETAWFVNPQVGLATPLFSSHGIHPLSYEYDTETSKCSRPGTRTRLCTPEDLTTARPYSWGR